MTVIKWKKYKRVTTGKVTEAIQVHPRNIRLITDYVVTYNHAVPGAESKAYGYIDTPVGQAKIKGGDWVIKDDSGQFIPVDDEIFQEAYKEIKMEPVDTPIYTGEETALWGKGKEKPHTIIYRIKNEVTQEWMELDEVLEMLNACLCNWRMD